MKVATTMSFSDAARELSVSVPAVSKSISRLEAQLDVRLLERTTHQVSLTQEGRYFFENCLPSVNHLVQAANEIRGFAQTTGGTIRISSTVGFGRKCIAPLLPGFCERYPDIKLEFDLSDRVADFSEGHVDVAIRSGRLPDADLVARQLAPMRLIICASPEYLRRAGHPHTVAALQAHRSIGFRRATSGKAFDWELEVEGVFTQLDMPDCLLFNDADLVSAAAVAGMGLAQLANYQADALIASGQLVAVMPETIAEGRGHYLCYKSRKNIPVRSRLFIDYLLECFHCPAA